MILLKETQILSYLTHHPFDLFPHVHLFSSIDSTNQFLKELPKSKQLDICCAETQTSGRGRFGRDWFSPFGENIYCSSRWYFSSDCKHLSALSLVVALAVTATLQAHHIKGLGIKWPNDILWQGKKLCGILIEMTKEKNKDFSVIIGIGLNVNSVTKDQTDHDKTNKPRCSLYEITGNQFDRSILIAQLIIQLERHISQFIKEGFISFIPEWLLLDCLYGKEISVFQPMGRLDGIAKGVTLEGQLMLVDAMSATHHISSGVASLSES